MKTSHFQITRGKGGIAILWPRDWSNSVKRLEEGNERVQAVEFTTTQASICVINVYLPTLKLPISKESYQENLDMVHHIIQKYAVTHKVIVCGDFNGSLSDKRTNPHDILLKNFVKDHNLYRHSDHGDSPTFIGHTGSSSQIDYVLVNCQSVISRIIIEEKSPLNMSSHVPVLAQLTFMKKTINCNNVKTKTRTVRKLNWEKLDRELYHRELEKLLLRKSDSQNTLTLLINALKSAGDKAVPSRLVKTKGPKFKLSPTVKKLESECKQIFFQWKQAGSPSPEHPLSIQRKVAKYEVRKQIRREFACARDSFYAELMDNPSDKLFYKLIRRNQSCASKLSTSMLLNGKELNDCQNQCGAFAAYFEDLAAPKAHPNFSQEYLDSAIVQESLIDEITKLNPDELILVSGEEVFTAIKSLNSGKASDEMELSAEHLKYSDKVVIPLIVEIFNDILTTKTVPKEFKSGIIYPIHKKGKNPRHFENYRGITISSVLGKLFETVILNRLHQLNADQSQFQYGFTKGLSPSMASLLLSEAVLDAKMCNRPIYIATLDAQKAFDVVSHPVLMVKLYEQGINSHLWQLIRSMYNGLTARVKWEGEMSSPFNICQGVRQGGILSTHLYKTYNNDLLTELESRCLGKFIGPLYVGCPTVADDVLLISENDAELQLMLNLSYIKSQEKRYHIHPQKSVIVRKNISKAKLNQEVVTEWKLGSTSVNVSSQSVHHGLIRAEKSENNINITDRISLARRTLYALIKSGVHGSNGLNPKVSYKIYQAYVTPRLLFNLETLPLTATQLGQLQRFHVSTLRNLQSLPVRTASAVVLLLLGALPIQAEIHRRKLSLIHSIARSHNTRMQDVMYRQLAVGHCESFFSTTKEILDMYDLPDSSALSKFTKFQWKNECRKAVASYWSEKMRQEASEKSSLIHCNLRDMAIGKTHIIWENVGNNTVDVQRGITKARMLTGVYMLQSTKAKFNQYNVEQICPLCRLASEDLQHMCPALAEVRGPHISSTRKLLSQNFGMSWWRSRSSEQIVALCLDGSNITVQSNYIPEEGFVGRLEALCRHFCHKLHMKRLQLHRKLLQ